MSATQRSAEMERFETGSSDNTEVTKTTGLVGSLTLLSRILGYVRDMMIAWFFGASLYSDVFIAVFRIPDFTRRVLNEGVFGIAFIPVFTRYRTQRGAYEASEFASATFRFLSLFLGGGVLAGGVCAPLIGYVIAPGFAGFPEKFHLTVTLVRMVLPYVFCIGLAALCMGILNALGHFLAPALAPTLLNLSMIAAMVLLALFSDDNTIRILGLAAGVTLGGGIQLLLQLRVLMKKGVVLLKRGRFFHPGIKTVATAMGPAIIGVSVFQINTLFDTLLASLLGEGAISYLYYADRLVQFPLGIFAVSIATVLYPTISRQASVRDLAALNESVRHSVTLVFFVSLPSMVGLLVLREPVVALLFKRGAFDAEMTRLTASALLYYGIGIWAFAAVRIVVSVFYALNDTRTPVRAGLVAIAANIMMGLLLMQPLSHSGLALATSLSSILNFWFLAVALRKKIGTLMTASVRRSVCGSALCAVAMGAVVYLIAPPGAAPSGAMDATWLALRVCGCMVAGLVVYGVLSFRGNRATLMAAVDIFR